MPSRWCAWCGEPVSDPIVVAEVVAYHPVLLEAAGEDCVEARRAASASIASFSTRAVVREFESGGLARSRTSAHSDGAGIPRVVEPVDRPSG
jgi:hypothetical protein